MALAPLVPEHLISELIDAHDSSKDLDAPSKLNVHGMRRPRLPPFRGMWKSSRLATNSKTRQSKEGLHRQISPRLHKSLQASAPGSAPASLVSAPIEMAQALPLLEHDIAMNLAKSLNDLETASSTGSRRPRRISNLSNLSSRSPAIKHSSGMEMVALPSSIDPPLAKQPTPGPPTPCLGLRPPGADTPRSDAVVQLGAGTEGNGEPDKARPGKPKISGTWGRKRSSLIAIEDIANTMTPLRLSRRSSRSEDAGMLPLRKQHMLSRVRLARPRPACRFNPHLEHTVLLRNNEFTTATAQYRTYGAQWVLAQRRKQGALEHLREEVERARTELEQAAQQGAGLLHGLEKASGFPSPVRVPIIMGR